MLIKFKKRKQGIIAKFYFTAGISLLLPGLLVAEENSSIPAIDCMIEPSVMVDLSSSVAGVIDTLTVDKSDQVKKGQIIATLKSDIEQVNVRSSRERLKLSAAEYRRAAELYKEKAITKSEKEQSDNDKKLAELELKHATTNLNLRKIKSPIDGVVVKRYANPGEFVETKPILQLAQLNPLRIEVVSPVANYGKIVKGMRATIVPEFGDYKNLVAKVVVVDKVIDAASGTFSVRLELDNKDYAIPGGLKCSAKFMSVSLATLANKKPQNNFSANVVNQSIEVKMLTSKNGTSKSDSDSMLCNSIGPYKKQKTLSNLLSQLKAEIKNVKLRTEAGERILYQVVSSLFNSEVEAKQEKQKMQNAGLTEILFLHKANKRKLVLGVFNSKSLAMKRIDKLRSKGFKADIKEKQQKTSTYFADIVYAQSSASKISKRIMRKYSSACDDSVKINLLE